MYFHLEGSRVNKKSRLIFNLFVVWFLTGIWHGAGWKFIALGILYFFVLTFEKLTDLPKKLKTANKFTAVIYQIFTMFFVMIGWVIFGEGSLKGALKHILDMFGLRGNTFVDLNTAYYLNNYYLLLIAGILLSTPILKIIVDKVKIKLSDSKLDIFEISGSFVYMIVLFVSISFLVIGAHNPFIYFNF